MQSNNEVLRLKRLLVESSDLRPGADLRLEQIVDGLSHDRTMVRRAAAYLLGELGDLSFTEPLTDALYDPDRVVVRIAESALGKIGYDKAVEPLMETIRQRDDSQDVRCSSLCAVSRIVREEATLNLATLVEFVTLSNKYCRAMPHRLDSEVYLSAVSK